jgi:hypothetical protein
LPEQTDDAQISVNSPKPTRATQNCQKAIKQFTSVPDEAIQFDFSRRRGRKLWNAKSGHF